MSWEHTEKLTWPGTDLLSAAGEKLWPPAHGHGGAQQHGSSSSGPTQASKSLQPQRTP